MIQECIIIRTGADSFDVIVGHRLNDRPLSRAEANHLAHARRRYQESARAPAEAGRQGGPFHIARTHLLSDAS